MPELSDLFRQSMALLHEAVEAKKFDVRVLERNVSRGVIHADDVEKLVKKLPDDSEMADWVNLETLESDESGSNHDSANGRG